MNFSIEGIDDVVDKLTQYASGDKIQRGLAMAGEVVRAHAVANCPVATGRLKGSIVSQVDGDSVAIGPTADYGIYVEFGTGSKGDKICFAYVKKTLDVLQWRSILHNVGSSTKAVPRPCTEK